MLENSRSLDDRNNGYVQKQPMPTRISCLDLFVLIALFSSVFSITLIRFGAILISSAQINNLPRQVALVGTVVQFLVLGFLLLPLTILWRGNARRIFLGWLIINGFILITAPNYLLDYKAFQSQALILIMLFLLCNGMLFLIQKLRNQTKDHEQYIRSDVRKSDHNSPSLQSSSVVWLTILSIALMSWLPWLALGAFGSPLDTVLAFALAFCLGLAISLATSIFNSESNRYSTQSSWREFFVRGLAASGTIVLIIGALSFSFGGLQLLILLTSLPLGWLIVLIELLFNSTVLLNKKPLSISQSIRISLPSGMLAASVLAAPLSMIDPDELLLIVSVYPGEILFTAMRAASWTFLILVGITLGLLLIANTGKRLTILYSRTPSSQRNLRFGLSLGNLGLLVLAIWVFYRFGQPGFYGERLFVILKSQADLTNLSAQHSSSAMRREAVYDMLVQHATVTQAELRGVFDQFGINYTPYYLVNALEVDGGPLLKAWLRRRSDIDRVLESPRLRPLPNQPSLQEANEQKPVEVLWNQSLIHADRVWQELHIQGEGIVIGQSDSGVQWDHPEIRDNYMGKSGDHDYHWYDPWNHSQAPVDIGGHGTHTLATVLGETTGIAPKAQWIACVNLARNLGNPAFYLDCMQFMLAPFPLNGDPFLDGRPELGANILNNSWGCPEIEGCDATVFIQAVKALEAAGVFFVASAGNDGPACGSLKDPPSIYEQAFSVGAIDQNGELAFFSSIGPVTMDQSNRIKPDLVAPGVDILSAMPNNTYGKLSGTSMAGPHVAGTVALMWSANPALIGQVGLTRELLIESAQPFQGSILQCPGASDLPSTATGYGIVDAYQAVKLALEAR